MKTRQIKRTFFQFLGYYLLVALLPLACIVILYCNDMLENSRQYIQENFLSATQGVMRSLDSHLSIINEYPQQLASNRIITQYRYQSTSLNRREVINELKRTVGGNTLVSNLFLYFRTPDTFISAYVNSWNRQDVLEGKLLIYQDIPASDYMNLLETLTRDRVIPATSLQTHTQEKGFEAVTFLSTLPQNNRYAYATTITLVDAVKLRQLLQSGDSDAFWLMDPTGQVIVSQDMDRYVLENILTYLSEEETGAQHIRLNQEEMIFSYCRSVSSGYTLLRLTSVQPFIQERAELLRHVFWVLGALTLLIIGLIFFFMQRTFKPIQVLADQALRAGSDGGKKEGSAFSLIQNVLHSLETENIQLTTNLEKQNPILAQYAVRTLLSTPEDHWNQQAYEIGLSAGLRLGFPAYRVAVLQFDNVDDQLEAMKNMVECFQSYYIASFPEATHNRIVLLLGHSSPDALDGQPNVPISMHISAAGVGPVVNHVKGWNASYIRASFACDCCADMQPPGNVMHFEDIPQEAFAPAFPWECMQTLSAAINQSNTNMVRTAGRQLRSYMEAASHSNLEMVKSIYIEILKMCRDVMQTRVEDINQYLYAARLEGGKLTVKQMAEVIGELLDEFCRQVTNEWVHKENSPIYRSLAIISEEIGSEHLSLAYVAERVGMSPSRYSMLFPQEMNRNFKDYVSSLRINLAKQLLRTTDLQISAVAARVGYQNAYSFARFFKLNVGCAPNEYRKQLGGAALEKREPFS